MSPVAPEHPRSRKHYALLALVALAAFAIALVLVLGLRKRAAAEPATRAVSTAPTVNL